MLSLSPGPTSLENAAEVAKQAQMWRISDDHWDVWTAEHKPGASEFPFGTRDAFDRLAKWVPYVGPGSWPDEDMLPIGYLGPHPGWGEARQSRLTPRRGADRIHSLGRSPFAADSGRQPDQAGRLHPLPHHQPDACSSSIRASTFSRPVEATSLPAGFENARVWRATINTPGARGYAEYFGFFNLDSKPVTLRATWKELGLDNSKHAVEDAFTMETSKVLKDMTVTLPAHGSTVVEVQLQ